MNNKRLSRELQGVWTGRLERAARKGTSGDTCLGAFAGRRHGEYGPEVVHIPAPRPTSSGTTSLEPWFQTPGTLLCHQGPRPMLWDTGGLGNGPPGYGSLFLSLEALALTPHWTSFCAWLTFTPAGCS